MISHFADDFILDYDAVPNTFGCRLAALGHDLKLETGHEVVQQVSHFRRREPHQFVDAVVLRNLQT